MTKKIISWLFVISIIIMEDVNGLRVIPVRHPAIPQRIMRLVSEPERWKNSDSTEPMLAPTLSDGAKMPPAAPVANESIVPKILRIGIFQGKYLSSENNVPIIISFP